MAQASGEEKRCGQRHGLLYYLRVIDRESGKSLGHLVDIAEGGIMLVRETALPPGQKYAMRLRWRDENGQLASVDFDAVCRWSRPDSMPGLQDAGFAIPAPDAETIKVIRRLIATLSIS